MLIEVTAEDIRDGDQRECFRCPIASAATRATGYESGVLSVNWELYLKVGHLYVPLPLKARSFVMEFDDAEARDASRMEPFSFEIPEWADSSWKEKCQHCESLFLQSELDDEGHCEDCRE